jgi:hypothetical protein
MGSSFKGEDLFGSGPHVFTLGVQGRRVVSYGAVTGDASIEGSFESGDQELRISVKGRLVATSESALWSLRDAIAAEAAFGVSAGDLIDHHGHTHSGVKLLQVEWDGPVQRGRVLSVGYEAMFGDTD